MELQTASAKRENHDTRQDMIRQHKRLSIAALHSEGEEGVSVTSRTESTSTANLTEMSHASRYWKYRPVEIQEDSYIMDEASLKLVVPGMQGPQARMLIREAVALYRHLQKPHAEMRGEMTKLRKVMFQLDKLDLSHTKVLRDVGRACNNRTEVAESAAECYNEMRAANNDLGGWLLDDPQDVPLPGHLLRPLADEDLPKAESEPPQEAAGTLASPGESLMGYVKNLTGACAEQDTSKQQVDIVEGGHGQLMSDADALLTICRAAGLSSQTDEKRRLAAGRVAKVVERDDNHGVVRGHVPGIGDVWFPLAAFIGKATAQTDTLLDELESSAPSQASEASGPVKIQELETELEVGRETVAEALQAVGELHGRLQRTRAEKRHAIDRFHQLRNRAVQLSKENRQHRERFQEQQDGLKTITQERDDFYDKVKSLVEENQELKSAIEARFRRSHGGRRHQPPPSGTSSSSGFHEAHNSPRSSSNSHYSRRR